MSPALNDCERCWDVREVEDNCLTVGRLGHLGITEGRRCGLCVCVCVCVCVCIHVCVWGV